MKNFPNLFTNLGRLRFMVYVEGLTLLTLVSIGVPLKHLGDQPEFVKVLGPIHGAAFVVYALLLVECSIAERWKASEIFKLSLAAFIPLGFISSLRFLAHKNARE